MVSVGAVAWGSPLVGGFPDAGVRKAAGNVFKLGVAALLAVSGAAVAVSQVDGLAGQSGSAVGGGVSGVVGAGALPADWTESVLKTTGADGLVGLLSLPVAVQVGVNELLGSDQPVFDIRAVGDGFVAAEHPFYGYASEFSSTGVVFRNGAAVVGLDFTAVSAGGVSVSPAAVDPVSTGSNMIVYEHGVARQRFVNGPLGVAQSFDVPVSPAGKAAGGLVVSLTVSGAAAQVSETGDVVFTAAGGAQFEYGRLLVRDAVGKVLPAGFAVDGNLLHIGVDDTAATYPINIDPFTYMNALSGGYTFGYAVAADNENITDNVAWAVIGDPSYQNSSGRAFLVEVRQDTGKLTNVKKYESPDDAASYGYAVDIDVNSTFVPGEPYQKDQPISAIGAPWYEGFPFPPYNSLTDHGAVFVESEMPDCKGRAMLLSGSPGNWDHLGKSVTILPDRKVAAGAPDDDVSGKKDAGSVSVWLSDPVIDQACWKPRSTYSSYAVITGAEQASDQFGYSLASGQISENNYLLVGAPGESANDTGAARLYTVPQRVKKGNVLVPPTYEKLLLPGNGLSKQGKFGYSVAIDTNNNVMVVGAPTSWQNRGSAYVFQTDIEDLISTNPSQPLTETGWLQQLNLLAPLSEGDMAGAAVAIHPDAQQIFVGAPKSEHDGPNDRALRDEGSVLVFNRGNGWTGKKEPAQWLQSQRTGDKADSQFGFSLTTLRFGEGEYRVFIGRPYGGGDGGSWNHVEQWKYSW